MAALTAGIPAPDFTLQTTDGKSFSLKEARKRGPVVLAFFKVSCPVCQFTLPYFQRLHEAYSGDRLTVVGISQNSRRETLSFMRDYGVKFPVVLDDPSGYRVSNAYGLTIVPTIFVVGSDGKIQLSSVGWVRQEIEQIGTGLAHASAASRPAIFQPGEDVPEFKPG